MWLQNHLRQGCCQKIKEHARNQQSPGILFSLPAVCKCSELMEIFTKLDSQIEAKMKKKLKFNLSIIRIVLNYSLQRCDKTQKSNFNNRERVGAGI